LRELYGLRDDETIAKEMCRPVESVQKMAEQIFAKTQRTGPWTTGEVERLKQYIGASAPDVIARVFGRPLEEVQFQIAEMSRMKHSGSWSQDEVVAFKRLYGTRTEADLAVVFGRSEESVFRLADKLCLAKDKAFIRKMQGTSSTKMPRWSDEEVVKLRELYGTSSNLEIAQALERSVKSVVSKAHNLGLKKSSDRLQQMGRQNVNLRYKRSESEGVTDD
jgi:hypothetical protein|tara:strand:- start:157 stop:816 length:660 start_codon:yes stop_codon:yes gene_type:complete